MGRSRAEQLRLEQEAFDILKGQAKCWFVLRLITGYVRLGVLVAIAIVCGMVILGQGPYPELARTTAPWLLEADILIIAGAILKFVINPSSGRTLMPITASKEVKDSGAK